MEPWDHDPDANYNDIFLNVAVEGVSSGNGKKFSQSFYHFPGSVTVLKFANGTTMNVQSYATTSMNFDGVKDGNSFFQKFCTGPSASGSASASAVPSSVVLFPSASSSIVPRVSSAVPSGSVLASSSSSLISTNNFYTAAATASPIPALPFFPEPILKSDDNSIVGYFPEDQADLAVITLPTFQPRDDYTYQNVFRTLLATAKASGKSKLIVDVRGNGGGTVVDGYSLFTELFPSMMPWGGANMAAWGLFNAIGEVVGSLSAKNQTIALQELDSLALTQFLYKEDLATPTTGFSS